MRPGLLLPARRPGLVPEDLRRCEGPVPQPPRNPGMADLGGQLRGRHEHDRAACPGHAVADNPAAGHAPKRAPMPCADHEHITRVIGDAHQEPGRPPLHVRLHPRLWPRSAPHRREGLAQPLARHLVPRLHEPGGGLNPRRPVTAGRLPRKNRYQHSAMRQREILRVTQRGQAAGRAADAGDHPGHARHDDRQLRRIRNRSRPGGRTDSCQRTETAIAGRGTLPEMTTQPFIPEPRRADTHPVHLPTRLPGAPANKVRPRTGPLPTAKDGTSRRGVTRELSGSALRKPAARIES